MNTHSVCDRIQQVFSILRKKGNIIAFPIGIYILWRIGILFFQVFIQPNLYITQINKSFISPETRIFFSWVTFFDSNLFTQIAQNGYSYPLFAFFPFWPMIIRLMGMITSDIRIGIYLSSLVFGGLDVLLLFLVSRNLLGERRAKRVIIAFLAYPMTFFLCTGYAEPIFLFFVLSAFYFLQKRMFTHFSLFAACAGLTKMQNLALIPVLMTVHMSLKSKVRVVMIAVTGLGLYMIYLGIAFHDPFLMVKSYRAWCVYRETCLLQFPFFTLVQNSISAFQNFPYVQHAFLAVHVSFLPVFCLIVYDLFLEFPLSYAVYAFGIFFLSLLTGSAWDVLRYMMIAFPIFYVLERHIRSRWLFVGVVVCSFLLQLAMIEYFTNQYFVG